LIGLATAVLALALSMHCMTVASTTLRSSEMGSGKRIVNFSVDWVD